MSAVDEGKFYHVCYKENLKQLEDEVDGYLENAGWDVCGSLFQDNLGVFCQPLIKR